MLKKVEKAFNWGWFKFAKCILGIFVYSLSVNLFIVPNNLYTGGILGLSQLIRSFIVAIFNLNIKFDISSIIYYLVNIPLFIIAYKKLNKNFLVRTVFAVSVNSLFLMIIPIPSKPLVPEMIANVLIGGILGGVGIGWALSTGGSTGGTDIIGLVLSKRNKKYSVGNIGLMFNLVIYSVCGIMYGVPVMIYSIIYSVFDTIMIDRTHSQNICSEAFIFSKVEPQKMIEFITKELKRDATYWTAVGGYTNSSTYIIYTVLSKYERMRLERHMNEFDPQAFMVSDDGVDIKGEFRKYLT